MTKVLAIIPARGGSKGIPNKNVRELNNKPLICYTIEAAIQSMAVTKTVVSTDSELIEAVSTVYSEVEVLKRPPHLAGDNSLVIDTVRYVIEVLESRGEQYDIVALLEPTSPLRTFEDIDNAVKLLLEKSADSIASVTETKVPPARIWKVANDSIEPFIEGSNAFLPRQQLQKGYYLNGVIYLTKVDLIKENPNNKTLFFGKVVPLIMLSNKVVDIDEELDLKIAEIQLKWNNEKNTNNGSK